MKTGWSWNERPLSEEEVDKIKKTVKESGNKDPMEVMCLTLTLADELRWGSLTKQEQEEIQREEEAKQAALECKKKMGWA